MDTIKQVYTKVRSEYSKNVTNKLMMVDALACYCVVTGLVQLVYMILVGNFPFNSFLSGFICHVGIFACTISLRLQLTSTGEFKSISPEKAFGDFAFCVLVLLFVVFSFLG
mmetsp:Transcript_105785/g.207475  ORF Transcript_105785/g.207475 Transcript_105785/m.207475 type:complete len:111 (+) Transcript_105785:31-363(+)